MPVTAELHCRYSVSFQPVVIMSVDGAIISDMHRLLSEKQPISFFILLCGQSGCGKSTTLRAVGDGAAARGMNVTYGAPILEEADTLEWNVEKANLHIVDFNTMRSMDVKGYPDSSSYRPGTVVILDDIESIYHLMHMQGVSHRLELFLRLLLSSSRSALITSAIDASRVPQWLIDMKAPVVYHIPELTASATRRYIRTLPEADVYASCADEGGGDILASCLRTQRDLTLYLCCAKFRGETRHPINSGALHFSGHLRAPLQQLSQPDRKLFGLDAVADRIDALVRHFIGRDGSSISGLLSTVASTTGILLHGPPGSGKTALAMRYHSLYPGKFFSVNCATLFSKYLGESEQRLREAFVLARSRAPSILFLDGVDVIGSSRGSMSSDNNGGGVDISRRMLAALLCELDGLSDGGRVLVIAATAVPNKLDSALLRQGRFETLQYVPPLSYGASCEMALDFFERFIDATEYRDKVKNLAALVATRSEGSTPASLRAFLRVLLEKQLELSNGHCVDGTELPLPSTTLVRDALGETNQLIRADYAFAAL